MLLHLTKLLNMNNVRVIGLMSGTSLDGTDIAYCSFPTDNPALFKIIRAQTIAYDRQWQQRLSQLHRGSAEELVKTQYEYSLLVAEMVVCFLRENELAPPDLIAFHGHTIFHTPDIGITYQLGSPAILASATGISVVGDFRSANVVLGGQGAPLVPIGDLHLFPEYDACLNLGGFGNISIKQPENLIAFDICAVNMALNELVAAEGKSFDENGELAASGRVDENLLAALNELPFYRKKPPKSLGREWYEQAVRPILDSSKINTNDKLATYCEHIAEQVVVVAKGSERLLITGGGAHHSFLVSRIRSKTSAEVIIPELEIIDFKEALIFAHLGLLRIQHNDNCLESYTGASRSHCAGSLHLP